MIGERSRNDLGWLLVGFVGIVIYGIGLLSPLTPSEGVPSVTMILVWVGIPLGLVSAGALLARSKVVKGMMILEVLAVITLSVYLLSILG
jgi:hypothetical protein